MKPWMHAVIYQTTWFVTVLLGNTVAMVWALVVLMPTLAWRQTKVGWMFIAIVTALGYGADLILQALGMIHFSESTLIGPIWLLVLWISFAQLIWCFLYRIPYIWLRALIGAVAGPLSYIAGAALGAAEPLSNTGILVFVVWWAIAFPGFIALRAIMINRVPA
jgi:hypothetical protein